MGKHDHQLHSARPVDRWVVIILRKIHTKLLAPTDDIGTLVNLYFVPDHAGVRGNERAGHGWFRNVED